MKKGLYISPTEFRNFSAVDKVGSLSSEIATRQRSIDFYTIGMFLPNPDPVLKKMGKDITIYKELRADPIVRGCITSRKARTKKLLWEIDRGKAQTRQTKFITDLFNRLPVRRMVNQILNAPLFGNQPLEVMWDVQSWTPKDVVGKPQQWFVYDENNELKFRTKDNYNGIALPEKKFLVASNDADYENPYGDAILSSCFWPVTFRKGGYKFWVTFTEKFGMPFIVGKQPRGTNQTETDAFADRLEQMVQDAIAVIPDDASVEIPETKNTGSADLYDKLIRACTGEINVALLGHSGGAESTPGKLGGEDTAGDTGENLGDDDQKMVEDTMNTLIDWICEYNFAERSDRPRFIMYEEEDVDTKLAERDEKLTTALGMSQLRLSKKYYQKGYALEDEDLEEAPAVPEVRSAELEVRSGLPVQQPAPAQFSSSPLEGEGRVRGGLLRRILDAVVEFVSPNSALHTPQSALDDALDSLSAEDLQRQAEGVLKPVIDLINKGTSYEDIMKDLVTAYPDMDSSALEERLSRAIFVAEAWGRMTTGQELKALP
ncbi:MAG: DUF935 domain-containing protein [Nitrospirae bacterium]|nr:DUF935 domain-containing protein [Nitrospirota bacterium]